MLEQPRFRELARNPMQLAILLHLIHARGAAFSEGRTALYQEYTKLFLNREAAKSRTVRENRELLLSVHSILAWVLHSRVEDGSSTGRMSESELQKCVSNFLGREGHGTDTIEQVDGLIQGSVERIGVLVSRVPGTFEFEVQLMREYFAARHLYVTAPYSSPGRERTGTRSERFEALAQNSYWTNVTRFFCGFHDRGELSSLVDGITDLGTRNGHELINQSRCLALILASDHVFSQVPRVTNRLIDFVTSEPGFQRLYSVGPPHHRREIEMPAKAGRSALFEACLAKLQSEKDPCRRRVLREIMARNASIQHRKEVWKSRFQNAVMVCDALDEAEDFGIIDCFEEREIKQLAGDDAELCVRWFVKLQRFSTITGDERLCSVAERMLFDGELEVRPPAYQPASRVTIIELLQSCFDPFSIARLFSVRSTLSVRTFGGLIRYPMGIDLPEEFAHGLERDSICDFADFVSSIQRRTIGDLQRYRGLWSELVDRGFSEVPGSFAMMRIALIATAGLHSAGMGVWNEQEFAPTTGLMSRLCFARRKALDAEWWKERLLRVRSDSMVACLAAVSAWVIPSSDSGLLSEVGRMMDQLDSRDWRLLQSTVQFMVRAMGEDGPAVSYDWFKNSGPVSPRLAHIAITRFKDIAAARKASRIAFDCYDGMDESILRRALDLEVGQGDESIDWDYVLRLSTHSHAVGACSWFSGWDGRTVPSSIAEDVLRDCTNHCLGLVAICESAYSDIVTERASKLSDLAASERWFETPC